MILHLLASERGLHKTIGRCVKCGFMMWPQLAVDVPRENWDYTSDPEIYEKADNKCSTPSSP
jgi:hypothetical protein